MFINYSLRTKMIVAFLVVALLALGPLAFLNTYTTRAALTDEANRSLLAAASQTAACLDAVISDNLDAVRTEAMLPDVVKYLGLPPDQRPGSAQEARVADTLIDLLNKNLFYISSYALLDRQGRNVVDTLQSDIGQDESDRDYFQTPLRTGLSYVSPVEFAQTAGRAYFYFSSPVRDEARQTVGVLRVRYSVGVLQKVVSESQGLAREGSFAILLDENHLFLAHDTAPELTFKTVVPLDPARVAELRAAGRLPNLPAEELSTNLPALEQGLDSAADQPLFVAEAHAGGDCLEQMAVVRLETQPWFVVYAQPQAVFLAPIEEALRATLVLAAIITALVVAAAIVMAHWLTGPITRLTAVAEQITAGDLAVQARVESGDEIGRLALTFNSMTARLRQTWEGLEQRNQQLYLEITERQRVEGRAQRLLDQQIAVNRLALALGEFSDLDKMYHIIYEHVRALMDAEAFIVSFYDDEEQLIRAGYVISHETVRDVSNFPPIPLEKVGHGTQSQVIRSGEPLYAPNVRKLMEKTKTEYKIADGGTVSEGPPPPEEQKDSTNSALYVPMKIEGQTIGVMQVQSHRLDAYSQEDINLLSAMANVAAIAIQNARLYEAVQQELTERKRAEEALKRYSEQLEEMVEERTQELHDAQEQMLRREKLAVLGQLAGGVGHDLRNPLGVISNAVYFLKMVHTDADETTREYLGIIKAEVVNAEAIVSDLMDFARTREPAIEQVSIPVLIADLLTKCPPPENVKVNTDLLADLPPVFVDPRQVKRALVNLVTNAYQAMPEGGRLTIETSEVSGKPPRSLASSVEPSVAISITDTGCGIPDENIKKLFEPLFTTKSKGVGLGLATVKNLVEANGGIIEVESKTGKGSTFTVRLPVCEERS